LTFLDCCNAVRAGGLKMIRPREGSPARYDIKEPFDGSMAGWMCLDATTANVVCQVHDALRPENQEKLRALSMETVLNFCWRVANGESGVSH